MCHCVPQVLTQLWQDIKLLKGKVLAAYLKAVGHIIPLMEDKFARFFTEELMLVLIREFQTPDEEMKKIVLKVRTVVFVRSRLSHLCGPAFVAGWHGTYTLLVVC